MHIMIEAGAAETAGEDKAGGLCGCACAAAAVAGAGTAGTSGGGGAIGGGIAAPQLPQNLVLHRLPQLLQARASAAAEGVGWGRAAWAGTTAALKAGCALTMVRATVSPRSVSLYRSFGLFFFVFFSLDTSIISLEHMFSTERKGRQRD